jgi:hypothetical protein
LALGECVWAVAEVIGGRCGSSAYGFIVHSFGGLNTIKQDQMCEWHKNDKNRKELK